MDKRDIEKTMIERNKEYRTRRKELHKSLKELITFYMDTDDYYNNSDQFLEEMSVSELIKWSYDQCIEEKQNG